MKKIVINTCYGGFGLSPLAIKRYYELAQPEKELFFYEEYFSNGEIVFHRIHDLNAPSKHYPITVVLTKDHGDHIRSPHLTNEDYIPVDPERDDPFLAQVVEELREKANGENAKLEIKEVNGKYRICEYDGLEWIETPENIEWKE